MMKINIGTFLMTIIIACFLLGTPAFGQGEDALYVAPSGFIGLGTSSPSNMLQMHDSDNSGYNFTAYTNGNTGTAANRGFVVGGSTYGAYSGWVWNRENGPLYFGTNNTYRMTISSAGSLQIGSTISNTGTQTVRISTVVGSAGTVVNALHLDAAPYTAYDKGIALAFGLQHSTYGEYTSRIVHYGYADHTRESKLQLQTHSSSHGVWNTGILMDGAGNVGVGTTSPSYALHVYENNSDVAVYARNEHATGLCVALEGLAYGGGTNYGIYTQAYGGTTNYAGYFNGNVYGTANASFASFTDRTPLYEGDALSEIAKISGKDGEIDHSTLPAFAHVKQDVPVFEETELEEITPEDAFEIVMVEQDKIVETTDDNGKVVETKIEIGAKTESKGYQLEDGKVVEVVNEIPVYETEAVATKQLRNDVYFDERTGKVYVKTGDGQIFEKDGKIYQNNQTGIKVEEQRDIGAMVSILTVAVQQLDKANKELREKIAVLESKLK